MSRGRSGTRQKVKTAKGRKIGSTRWLERQLNDPYVKQARAEGYRSRAAYKLLELDERFKLVRNAKAVVGIDLLDVDPIEGVTIFKMDFMDDAAPDMLIEALGSAPDLVLSDMAANTVGHQQTDHLRTMGLVEAGAYFAVENLQEGGAFVAKVLAGGTDNDLLTLLKKHFTVVKHAKPPASRKGSSEWYVIAQGFKGRAEEA